MHPLLTLILVALILLGIVLVIVVSMRKTRAKYKQFVIEHSLYLRSLIEIKSRYPFFEIEKFDMVHAYDNENFFNGISPKDYLIYQLVYIQKKVERAARLAEINRMRFLEFMKEYTKSCRAGEYDVPVSVMFPGLLAKIERQFIKAYLPRPTIKFSIFVRLILTTINGHYCAEKSYRFSVADIETLIHRINQKDGNFYLDYSIFNSICRVERGKVTNRVRFAIYERDGYRCCKCGSTENLEVDHIIPIAKGGKSTFDNLQTLCHDCNVKKGTKIDYHFDYDA